MTGGPARFGRLTDPPATFTLVGARVIDPAHGADAVRDLAVRDGVIVDRPAPGADSIDAAGLVVAPGFCDLHVHLREPGLDGSESIESGAQSAARGGFTTICAMPNTDPPLDDPELIRRLADRAAGAAARVRFIGAATRGRHGQEPGDLEGLARAGVVAVSDDGSGVPTEELAATIVRGLTISGLPLIEHAEDAALAGSGVMRAGTTATRLGLAGWAPEAEVSMVERDIWLAEEMAGRVHLTHLSTAAAMEAVRAAKSRGVPVTADVTPHHLALTDEWVAGSRRFSWEDPEPGVPTSESAYDGVTRVNPPLASGEDALALLAGLEDGTIDAIATDHAPHPVHRKLVPFADAAPGLIGLETALSVGLAAVRAGRLSLGRLLEALSTAPARIVGERRSLAAGQVADLVALDPQARWRVEATALASGATNTPLVGMELPGIVRLTVAGGRVTYRP